MNNEDILFWVFVAIFVATAVITLLGITHVIKVKYLKMLFGALLLELIGVVIAWAPAVGPGGGQSAEIDRLYKQIPPAYQAGGPGQEDSTLSYVQKLEKIEAYMSVLKESAGKPISPEPPKDYVQLKQLSEARGDTIKAYIDVVGRPILGLNERIVGLINFSKNWKSTGSPNLLYYKHFDKLEEGGVYDKLRSVLSYFDEEPTLEPGERIASKASKISRALVRVIRRYGILPPETSLLDPQDADDKTVKSVYLSQAGLKGIRKKYLDLFMDKD